MTSETEDEFQAAMIVGAATLGVAAAMAADYVAFHLWERSHSVAEMLFLLYPGHLLGGLAGGVVGTVVQPRVLRASGFGARALEAGVRGAALTVAGIAAGHVMIQLFFLALA